LSQKWRYTPLLPDHDREPPTSLVEAAIVDPDVQMGEVSVHKGDEVITVDPLG
jgi:hypothetical protein